MRFIWKGPLHHHGNLPLVPDRSLDLPEGFTHIPSWQALGYLSPAPEDSPEPTPKTKKRGA